MCGTDSNKVADSSKIVMQTCRSPGGIRPGFRFENTECLKRRKPAGAGASRGGDVRRALRALAL